MVSGLVTGFRTFIGERTSGSVHITCVIHLPVPSETALRNLLLVLHVVVLVVVLTCGGTHRRVRCNHLHSANGHTRFSLIARATQSSIKSVVVFVVVKVQSVQLGKVVLIRAHRVQVGNNLVLESSSFFLSSVIRSHLVTRDLQVLQVHKIALDTILDHPPNHSSHTLSLHCSISEHDARRTRKLSQSD